jgi:hypothetical protein
VERARELERDLLSTVDAPRNRAISPNSYDDDSQWGPDTIDDVARELEDSVEDPLPYPVHGKGKGQMGDEGYMRKRAAQDVDGDWEKEAYYADMGHHAPGYDPRGLDDSPKKSGRRGYKRRKVAPEEAEMDAAEELESYVDVGGVAAEGGMKVKVSRGKGKKTKDVEAVARRAVREFASSCSAWMEPLLTWCDRLGWWYRQPWVR